MRTGEHAVTDSVRLSGDAVRSVPLVSARSERGALVQKLQHVVPSVLLLFDGLQRFTAAEGQTVGSMSLAAIEVVSSALVIVGFIRSVRRLRPGMRQATEHSPHGVDWVDVFLGATLLAEALVHRQETGHLPRPTLLLAVALATIGVLHGRIAGWGRRRRELRLSADGISIWQRWHGRLHAAWSEISNIALLGDEALVTTQQTGSRRINLRDLRNRAEVEQLLEEALARLEAFRLAERETSRPLGR